MLRTERLILRRWLPRDAAPFAALNADPEVMAHFPAPLDRADSDAMIMRCEADWNNRGIGLAAAERRSDGALVGMVGLTHVSFASPCQGAVEIGWRVARRFWGQGLAAEAARAWLAHGFTTLGALEIVAFTVRENERSRALMHRLGMTRDPGRDFEHPRIAEGHRLRPHLVHAISRATWEAMPAAERSPAPTLPGLGA